MSLSHILDATPPSAICGLGMTSFPVYPSCSVLETPDLGLTSEWAPWTHKPDCHYSQLCLYTHAGACGRGISIITTSPTAAEDILQRLPANCSRSSPDTSSSPYFEVRAAGPGKGMGAFATRKIPRGTKLFDEAPAVLRLETAGQYADPGGAVSGSMMERAVAQLRRPEQVLELSQHDGFVGSRAQNAAAFNSFTVKYGEDAYAGIFPDISRLNHACAPNSGVKWAVRGEPTLSVWAWRDIQPGEELTLSYISLDPSATYAVRQYRLSSKWHFKCSCALCAAPAEERLASDARRARFADVAEQYLKQDVTQPAQAALALQLLDEALEINAVEPMFGSRSQLLLYGAAAAFKGGFFETAVSKVQQLEAELRERGFPDEEEEDVLRELKEQMGL